VSSSQANAQPRMVGLAYHHRDVYLRTHCRLESGMEPPSTVAHSAGEGKLFWVDDFAAAATS